MNRRLLCTALTILALAVPSPAKELDGVYTPAQSPCPSPDEAIKKMKVPDGYEVRCFASEPDVINPVAMTWDHRGRLWVVELYEYPRGAKNPNEYSKIATDEKFRPVVKAEANSPRDRVIILEDTDNDGKADKRTVFAEGLNLATGILCGYGGDYSGVFIGQAPNFFFFRDTNGDDKADEYKTVLTGFGLEDRHELLNSFTWGPDGWLYMTHGVFTHSKVRRPDQKPEDGFKLDAGVFRVKISARQPDKSDQSEKSDKSHVTAPHADAYEVYADGTSNPWGVDFDARGNAFVSACVIDHLFHMAPGGLYQRQGGAPENPYAYELLPSIVSHKHFRAAYAGIQIYQGGIYPPDTHGHVFIGNIHDNAIHEESLSPVGATFKAAPVRDFLRANDGWFRPVSTQTGPDGFLWVMDWCDKYPCYQNAQANPEGVDRERGRVWRVCYIENDEGKKLAGMSREDKELDFARLKPDELVAKLGQSNNWVRRFASALITQRQLDRTRRSLAEIVQSKAPSEVRVCALETLGSIFKEELALHPKASGPGSNWPLLSDNLKKELSNDPDPAIRQSLVGNFLAELKHSGEASGEPFTHVYNDQILLKLASDGDAAVRIKVANRCREHLRGMTLSGKPGPTDARPVLDNLILASAGDGDKTLAFSIWMSVEPLVAHLPGATLPWFADLAPKSKPLSHVLTYKTARRVTDTRKPENMDLLLDFLDKIKSDDVLTAHALDGMLKAQESGAVKPAKADAAPLFVHWRASKDENVRSLAGRLATLWGDQTAVAELIKLAEDPKTDPAKRTEAIKTLRKIDSAEARAALLRILEGSLPK